jgi:GNAT superfamily N-acetyltransferase
MSFVIEQWPIADAAPLATIWAESTADAPYAYSVEPSEFARGIIPDAADDESLAVERFQKLIVASDGTRPVAFAHLCAAQVEVDGKDIACGVIRSIAFGPDDPEAGQHLLEHVERLLRSDGQIHVDAFPLYHGYAFHNHKVGILSDRLTHITSLLIANGYRPHDPHLTLQRPLADAPLPDQPPEIEVLVEKTEGDGARRDIRVSAVVDGTRKGTCRSMTGRRYAAQVELEDCGYTRWLAVDEDYRQKGIGRYLLRRALHEHQQEGYTCARLNVREKNTNAHALYQSEGYLTEDRSSAYLKDLGV